MKRFNNPCAVLYYDKRKVRSASFSFPPYHNGVECAVINGKYEIWADGACYNETTGGDLPQFIFDLRNKLCAQEQ